MPPVERFVPRFAAEPPQEALPYGRWAERLQRELLEASRDLADAPEDLGEPGEIAWYPDRSWHGRTYVPATTTTTGGYELYGYVRYVPAARRAASRATSPRSWTSPTRPPPPTRSGASTCATR